MTVATRLIALAGKPPRWACSTDGLLVLRDVDAVDLVVGDVALLPLGPAVHARRAPALDLPEMACSSSADSWPAPGSSRSMTYFGIDLLLRSVIRLWIDDWKLRARQARRLIGRDDPFPGWVRHGSFDPAARVVGERGRTPAREVRAGLARRCSTGAGRRSSGSGTAARRCRGCSCRRRAAGSPRPRAAVSPAGVGCSSLVSTPSRSKHACRRRLLARCAASASPSALVRVGQQQAGARGLDTGRRADCHR